MGMISGLANWLGARGIGTPPDPHIAQARRDQKMAVTPGCVDGHMECLDSRCGCREDQHCAAFVEARAVKLRRQEFERLNMTAPWPKLTLPRAVLKERGTVIGDLVSAASASGVHYNIGDVRRMVEKRWPGMNKDEIAFVMDAGRGLDANWDLGDLPPDRTETRSGRAFLQYRGRELVETLRPVYIRGLLQNQVEEAVALRWQDMTAEEVALVAHEASRVARGAATSADISAALSVDTAREGVDTDASDGSDGD